MWRCPTRLVMQFTDSDGIPSLSVLHFPRRRHFTSGIDDNAWSTRGGFLLAAGFAGADALVIMSSAAVTAEYPT